MRFAFSDDQQLLQGAVREFLRKECTPEVVRALWADARGHAPGLWAQLAELGVLGALVPEAQGGMGLDERDLVLLLEEVGRAALPGPVAACAAVAAPLVRELGGATAERWLAALGAGRAIAVVGHPANPFVTDAHLADLLLLARGPELHAVERAAVRLVHQPASDPGRRLHGVEWEPGAGTRVASGAEAERLLAAAFDRGALAAAAQALGAADRMLELAVAYASQREQFGRPIGSFQAVQHQLADAKVRVEYARPVVYKAAWAVATGAASRPVDVSHAKLAAGEAAALAARRSLQAHGAIGYTWEQDLHLWMRRAWSLALEWGDPPLHLARVSDFVLADGAPIGPGRTFEGGS
ncbi:MAG: acyl-CoA/acyl-ACP dehydrogenase [Deltaproteobacteria bacterium]|nr:acyl-CoA/acyl-ACP dehydrogenase [Deltaproteobacteria bacterium]